MTYFFEISTRKIAEITDASFEYLIPKFSYALFFSFLFSILVIFLINLGLKKHKTGKNKLLLSLLYIQLGIGIPIVFVSYSLVKSTKEFAVHESETTFNSMLRIVYPAFQYFLSQDSSEINGASDISALKVQFAREFMLPLDGATKFENLKIRTGNFISQKLIRFGIEVMNQKINEKQITNLNDSEQKKLARYTISQFNLADWDFVKSEISRKMSAFFDQIILKIYWIAFCVSLLWSIQILFIIKKSSSKP